jgi:hypothetical protein
MEAGGCLNIEQVCRIKAIATGKPREIPARTGGFAVFWAGGGCFWQLEWLVLFDSVISMQVPLTLNKAVKEKMLNLTGQRIRQARLACKPALSQQELASQLARKGVVLDQTAISRIEQNQRGVLDYELAVIARCLKVSVAWLYGEKSSKPE